MSKKEYLRKKFLKLRKKKYFDITSNFFKPLDFLFKKNDRNLKSISIYYPTNYETNILKIFQYVFFKKFETSLPVILKKNRKIITIGVAFSFQKYHKLPTSKFDVKLNYILTEKGLLR